MNTYKRHRFPSEIISYAVWLYYRFNLSHRDIEDLLAERGITVDGLDHAVGYGLLPVVVRFRWQGAAGPATFQLKTLLAEY